MGRKKEVLNYEDQFSAEFTAWFDELEPVSHWNSLPSARSRMKRRAYEAYLKGREDERNAE